MAFNQVTAASLMPSRPAPQAPQRRGTETYTTNSALASPGYNTSFSLTPSSPSGSSYASSYSGIGGSPNRHSEALFNSHVGRNGMVSIKEDGFASWLWRPKWLVLKEQTLSIHKTEVSTLFISHGPCPSPLAISGIGEHGRCTAFGDIRHGPCSAAITETMMASATEN